MDIKLELTDRGLEVHVTGEFDHRFEERGRITTTLLREKLKENGLNVSESVGHTMINFNNQSDTWIFKLEESLIKEAKKSKLKCKDSRTKKKTTVSPEADKTLQKDQTSVSSQKKTKKKRTTEVE